MRSKYFRAKNGKFALPLFFPDATRGFVKLLDNEDLLGSKTEGILINTFHLWQLLDEKIIKKSGGIACFMNWKKALISDSGGFQVMSLIKREIVKGKITDEGMVFNPSRNKKIVFTPEESIRFQMVLGSDLLVVLDDFTDPSSDYKGAEISVERTIDWAKRSKKYFESYCKKNSISKDKRPYLIGVVQGGEFMDLRVRCTKQLVNIGFDGMGWGGWPFVKGKINYQSAKVISENSPSEYLLYGLGIGKPMDVVSINRLGFSIFDCVIPTREGRHGRLYCFNNSMNKIDLSSNFYTVVDIKKQKYKTDKSKVCKNCDCQLCTNYSKAYLYYLYKRNDTTAKRLCSIHNLRFYSQLMEILRKTTYQ